MLSPLVLMGGWRRGGHLMHLEGCMSSGSFAPTNSIPSMRWDPLQLVQFSPLVVYYLGGDLLSFILVRWLGDVLTVLAVRLPPPGAGPSAPKGKGRAKAKRT